MTLAPLRNDHRIIIHFDYDCFYASVFEVEQPVLKTLPLAVQQKQIVVTCNYEARRRGLRKLQLIKEAKQICPELVIVLGEDLSKFRDASKDLYRFLRAFCWSGKVEKLGFDELFLDVTDMITYNVDLLNPNDLEHSFFHLNRLDPTLGFAYDATGFCGPTYPAVSPTASEPDVSPAVQGNDPPSLRINLLVASHLAAYLRGQLEEQKGYTATVGISTVKLLAKLVGNTHKPNNQTTLLPPYSVAEQGAQSNVLNFLDAYDIRKIPGIGSKLTHKLTTYLNKNVHPVHCRDTPDSSADNRITVRDVRLFPGMGPPLLEKVLGGAGSPKGVGAKIWGLIHGVDNSDVLEARDLPTQISIEDSYGGLNTLEEVRKELIPLATSLIRRVRADLTEEDPDPDLANTRVTTASAIPDSQGLRWLAYPKTLRVSTRPKPPAMTNGAQPHSFNRISRSAPLPRFVFHLDASVDALAEQLVHEGLLPMVRKLHPEKAGWNIRLVNIAVTNMVDAAGEGKRSSGRDIGKMFHRQEMGRRYSPSSVSEPTTSRTDAHSDGDTKDLKHDTSSGTSQIPVRSPYDCDDGTWEESESEDDMPCVCCETCGAFIPHFALVAHKIYHTSSS
ncbi:hypothetical protein BDV25DRAFT_12013 [Aspergillus avenaceus]|uniref:UmuC domain-containing protein n=1 Tax=Aspergillus avenaceus TaxID=36643 RepID=A0A5N6TR36_ASPAV|nr:hypothetical protein BDV25DRAFT_12013 [Aspergillus avenaceus]